jgi:type 1 fimbria pilin
MIVITFFALVNTGAADVTFQDTVGDIAFPQNDITCLQVEVINSTLKVTIIYAEDLGLTDMNFGSVFIDADLDPDTGIKMGADCIINYVFTGVYSGGFINLNGDLFDIGQEGTTLETGTNHISFSLPLSLWGGNDLVSLFAASSWIFGHEGYDRVPNIGFLDTETGLTVIPRPGNEQVHMIYHDPVGDATFPDLSDIEMKVKDGDLLLWLTFTHSIERAALKEVQDILMIEINMDLDKRLWSGFRNNHEQPPTFGIDRSISLMLSDVFSKPQGSLLMRKPDDPSTPLDDLNNDLVGIGPLGSQENDTRFIVGQNRQFDTSSNQIFLSIPLSYLGYDDGDMFIMVSAFLQTTTSPGHGDSLPDSGALDSGIGLPSEQLIHPVASCTGPVSTGLDDPDDSLGFGFQGDEIVSSRACPLTDGGLMVTVDLESLAFDDLAYVNIFVDSDGNGATGIPVQNGTAETIGADFYLSCRIAPVPDPTIVIGLLVELRTLPLGSGLHRIDHLVSLRTGGVLNSGQHGGHYTINVPAEILQSVPGGVARYVITTTQQSFTNENAAAWKDVDGNWQCGNSRNMAKLNPQGAPSLLDTAPNFDFYEVNTPNPFPLSLSSVTPSQGPVNGATRVSIYGSNFARNSEVRLGDAFVPAEAGKFMSSGELSIITPAGVQGPATLVVTNLDTGEEVSRANSFFYGPPVITAPDVTGIEPSLGPIEGGNEVQIVGSNFLSGATVSIETNPASDVTVESPFLITATVPSGTIGPADVEVTNSDGQSGLLKNGYNYGSRPPEIWTMFPNFGLLSGDTQVTIVGERFQSAAQVFIGEESPLTQVNVVSDRLITGVTSSSATPGLKDIVVVNPDGVSGTLKSFFEYGGDDPGLPPPFLFGVSPLSSPTEGGVEVSISGSDFQNGVAVLFDNYPVRTDHFDSGLLKVTSPPHDTGSIEIAITNPDGQTVTLPADPAWNSFTYDSNQPTIWLVNPMTSLTTGGVKTTITGNHFQQGAKVEFGSFQATIEDISPITIEAFTPPHPPGEVDITVTNPGGLFYTYTGDIIFGKFAYVGSAPPPPVIDSIIPNQGSLFGADTVTIHGKNFFTGVRVFFGPGKAEDVILISENSVQATTPPSGLGPIDIKILNADNQQDILEDGFTYVAPAPTTTGITPNSGPTAGGTLLTIEGTGFLPESKVMLGGNPASGIVFIDQNILMCTAPPGFPGTATVTVINPGNQSGFLTDGFTYEGERAPAPQLLSIFPCTGDVQGGTSVAIMGQGFLSGVSVTIDGQPVSEINVDSVTSMTVVTPPGTAGAVDVVVTNLDEQSSTSPESFIYIDPSAPAPEIASITPSRGPTSGGTEVVISGQYFQRGIVVLIDDHLLADIAFVSAQEIHGKTPEGEEGTVLVEVINPDDNSGQLIDGFTYEPETSHPYDKDEDGDVDGSDLATYVNENSNGFADLADFAAEFGTIY